MYHTINAIFVDDLATYASDFVVLVLDNELLRQSKQEIVFKVLQT